MSTTRQMLNRFKALDLNKELAKAIKQTDDGYLQALKDQLSVGIDGKGEQLPAYRSKKYADYKEALGSLAPAGVPDYKVTGKLYNSLKLKVSGDDLIITSTRPYFDDLTARGGDPWHLAPDFKSEYSDNWLYPLLMQQIKDKTGTA